MDKTVESVRMIINKPHWGFSTVNVWPKQKSPNTSCKMPQWPV